MKDLTGDRKMEVKRFIQKLLVLSTMLLVGTGSVSAAKMPETTVPHQYPAKYTPEYIKQITPSYKDVGKDEVFYVALDMLKIPKECFPETRF